MIHAILILLAMSCVVFGTSTVGLATSLTGNPQDSTSGGGVTAMSLVASGGTVLVSPTPGRLQKIVVTASAAQSWIFYDTSNTSSQTGATVLAAIPASATVGTVYELQMPARIGIVAVPSGTGNSALTVSFN